MLTPERAREVRDKQKQWPYWGNYRKFMTPEEDAYVMELFRTDPSGNVTVASIVNRIAEQ